MLKVCRIRSAMKGYQQGVFWPSHIEILTSKVGLQGRRDTLLMENKEVSYRSPLKQFWVRKNSEVFEID